MCGTALLGWWPAAAAPMMCCWNKTECVWFGLILRRSAAVLDRACPDLWGTGVVAVPFGFCRTTLRRRFGLGVGSCTGNGI